MTEDSDSPDLGTCCICGEAGDVRALVMLPFKCQVTGHGWGCFVCGLPADGACAALCEVCVPRWQGGAKLQWACRGYPGTEGRVPIGDLTVPHEHDPNLEH